MRYLMGIDLGSTSIKAVIYDYSGNPVSYGTQPTPLSHLDPAQPTWSVWEPEKIWACVKLSVRQALSGVSSPDDVGAVAVTGFGMDGLPLDKSGAPLYSMISWHCPRTIPQSRSFSEKIGKKRIFELTGKQVMDIDSIYRMLWLKENHPELLEAADKWLLIEDFINFKLCGVQASDYSMATCTSVFDQRSRSWSKELIEAAGIPLSLFPPVYQSGTPLGTILPSAAEETGLAKTTQVVLGGHDFICGAYAVGAIDSNVLLDLTGTWEMLLLATDRVNLSDDLYDSGYYIEGHVATNRYMYVGSFISGDMTEWLKHHLSACDPGTLAGSNPWPAIIKAVEEAPLGSRGCFFLPHFSGAGAPFRDPNSMGAFLGLQNIVSRGDMMRAVFEGLDYQFRMMLESFQSYRLGTPERIIATGGAAKNAFWMQNKADITGLSLTVPDVYEATPLGAAMLAGLGCGVYKNDAEAVQAVQKPSVTYDPDESKYRQYSQYYNEVFCTLQKELCGINHKLSSLFR